MIEFPGNILSKMDLRKYMKNDNLFEMMCVGIFILEIAFFFWVYVHPKMFYAPMDSAAAGKHSKNAPVVQVATVVPDAAGANIGPGAIVSSSDPTAEAQTGKHGKARKSAHSTPAP